MDLNYNWGTPLLTPLQQIMSFSFINDNWSIFQVQQIPIIDNFDKLSIKQKKAFDIVQSHLSVNYLQPPLRMIIQGTAGIGKSHLIKSMKSLLCKSNQNKESTLLLLAPI